MTAVTDIADKRMTAAGTHNLGRVVRMEWRKLWSVGSTWWILLIFAAGLLSYAAVAGSGGPTQPDGLYEPTDNVMQGLAFGQLTLGVLGVLVLSGEFSSGSIRSTFAAVPRRGRVLAAKAVVVAAVALVSGEALAFAAALTFGLAAPAGVPHPPGYPVWTIYTWLWTVLWGAAFILSEAEEIRFDIIYSNISEGLKRLFTVITGIALIFLYGISLPASFSYVKFMKVERSAYLHVPIDLLYSIYVIFVAACICRYCWLVVHAIRGGAAPVTDPARLSD